ncbi:hypothetical protein PLCT1_00972 [Planctomycetaceae bacterium]|nr:hypothetical protein PLCT1_00972 [Planctomycetaceae bacterium]
MLTRTLFATLFAAMLFVAAQAEEAPVDLPYKVEVKGDKLETVEFTWTLKREFKRGTPADLVGEYLLAFGDAKDNPSFSAEKARLEAMVADYVHRLRFSVIDAPLAKRLEDAEKAEKEKREAEKKKSGSVSRTHLAPKITAEEKQDGGKVLVLLGCAVEEAMVDKAGVETKTVTIEKQRILCAKVGELWAVEKHEVFAKDWNAARRAGDEAPMTWQERKSVKDFLQFAALVDELLPKVENASAEAGARFILKTFSGFGEEFSAQIYSIVKLAAPLMELVRPLFTPETYKAAQDEAKAAFEKDKAKKKENPEKARELETHEKLETGEETFLFKPESDWGAKHWLKMKKTDGGWILVEIKKYVKKTQYEKDGSVKESWEEKPVERFSDIGW